MRRPTVGSARGPARDAGTAGFLLTETLATFTISAFVLLGLVSASSVILTAVDRNAARVQSIDDLSRTIDAIRRDVSGLARARWNGVEPQGFVFRGGPNSLFFAHAQRGPDGARATSVIALREIAAGGGTRLMRGEAPLSAQATGFGDLRFGLQRELGTGPARLRFAYVVNVDGTAERRQVPQWTDGRLLPTAVVVEAVDRVTGHVLVTGRVPIYANADIGCLTGESETKTVSPELAALNASAVARNGPGQTATPTDGAAPPPGGAGGPGQGEASATSHFCGRIDADKKSDQQNAAARLEPAPQTQIGPDR